MNIRISLGRLETYRAGFRRRWDWYSNPLKHNNFTLHQIGIGPLYLKWFIKDKERPRSKKERDAINDYIYEAMTLSTTEIYHTDDTKEVDRYFMSVPNLFGVWSVGPTPQHAWAELNSVLQDWIQIKIEDQDKDFPILNGQDINWIAPRHPSTPGWELGLQLDHVIPLSKGGTDLISNVFPSHGKCNLNKGSKIIPCLMETLNTH